jgi:hypothetical protein
VRGGVIAEGGTAGPGSGLNDTHSGPPGPMFLLILVDLTPTGLLSLSLDLDRFHSTGPISLTLIISKPCTASRCFSRLLPITHSPPDSP